MTDRFPLLTDEQIDVMAGDAFLTYTHDDSEDMDRLLARAVESATRAPLLAEIERLTAERDAALVDAERYHFIVNACEVTYMGRSIESTEDLDAAREEPTNG